MGILTRHDHLRVCERDWIWSLFRELAGENGHSKEKSQTVRATGHYKQIKSKEYTN